MASFRVKKWNGKNKMETVDILAMKVPLPKLQTYLSELEGFQMGISALAS